MISEMENRFYKQVSQKFKFLEIEHGFILLSKELREKSYYPDMIAKVQYLGKTIGLEVVWGISSGVITVVFTELVNGNLPETVTFWGEQNRIAKAIDIYTLVMMKNKGETRDFILGDINTLNPSIVKKRQKIIINNLDGILDNLVGLTKEHALHIIEGDTSIFPIVMRYKKKLLDTYN